MSKTTNIRDNFIKVNLYNDAEIGGRIYAQLCHLFPDALLSDQKDRFFQHTFHVMHKLMATKYHLENYKKIEEAQYLQAKQQFKKNPHETREALELIFEIEAFLFQIKSSLDMLVKLLRPAIGDKVVKTKTYSDKGDDLINGLNQYKKKKGVNTVAVDNLIYLIEDHKKTWISKVITLRDELNHDKGLREYKFMPRRLPNGEVVVIKPTLKKMNTLDFLKQVYSNNLIFHQDFMVLSLALTSPSQMFLDKEDPQIAIGMYGEKVGKYIVFCWRMFTEGNKLNQESL